MILYLKKKKQDAEKLKRERGTLDKYGIWIMNRLTARTDDDADQYNKNIVPDLEQMMVPYDKYLYTDPEYIDPNFVTSQDIETFLRNKFQKNSTVKKSDADIKDILTTTKNLINRTENPQLSLQALSNTTPNDSIFNDIINTANTQSEMETEEAEDENDRIDALINNGGSNSTSGSDVDFGVAKKRFKPDNSIDDVEFTDNLLQSNFNNIKNDPNAFNSNQSAIANYNANINAGLLNPIPPV
jgi:hypothetical protein